MLNEIIVKYEISGAIAEMRKGHICCHKICGGKVKLNRIVDDKWETAIIAEEDVNPEGLKKTLWFVDYNMTDVLNSTFAILEI